MDSADGKSLCCAHCGAVLQAFRLPEAAAFDSPYHLACFNNDCRYFREGWEWMQQNYRVHVSYRYRVDPGNGKESPLAVWSEDALVDRIIEPGPRAT